MTTYPLRIRDGASGLIIFLPDQGIALQDGEVSWTSGSDALMRKTSDLSQVRLAVVPGGGRYGQYLIGHCELSFRDGHVLTVFGGNSLGVHDATQAATYRRFVMDLRAQIAVEDRRRIVFFAGRARGKGPLPPLAIGLLVAVVLVTSAVLVAQVGAIGLLGLAILLGLMTLSFLPQMMTNSGRDYDPSTIPDRLTPL